MQYKDFLKGVSECPFCANVKQLFWEGNYAYLTYSIAPYHQHHLLVIPKRHVLSIKELTAEEHKDIQEMQQLAVGLLEKLGYTSMTLLVREGKSDMRSIEHVHFHVVPESRISDLEHGGSDRPVMTDAQIEQVVLDIQRVLR